MIGEVNEQALGFRLEARSNAREVSSAPKQAVEKYDLVFRACRRVARTSGVDVVRETIIHVSNLPVALLQRPAVVPSAQLFSQENAHMTPNRSKICPYQSPHGAFSNGMPTVPPPSSIFSMYRRASSGVSVVYSIEYAVPRTW